VKVRILTLIQHMETPEHFLVRALGQCGDGTEVTLLVSKATSVGDTVEWLGTADENGPPKILRTEVAS
jgi:hypothetical protein